MADRFYQLTYPENRQRPVYFEDAGNLLMISGILVQGMGLNVLMLSPGADHDWVKDDLQVVRPTLEEWSEFLRNSDNPTVFEEDSTGTIKVVHHKVEYSISGAIQQKIWYRDGWQCMYCGKKVPYIQLTIDHFVPLEKGGVNNETNYLSACRQCQKNKGNIDPKMYCATRGYDYDGLVNYLAGKASKFFINHLLNA